MDGEHMDCPKCAGTGKVPRTTRTAGRKQHAFDIGPEHASSRGPWGYGVYTCYRCKVERTWTTKGRAMYLVDGEWKAGVGCKPRMP